jgi:hypothetical protein
MWFILKQLDNEASLSMIDHSASLSNCSLLIFRADGAKRRARVLIPPGYLHPGKRKH